MIDAALRYHEAQVRIDYDHFEAECVLTQLNDEPTLTEVQRERATMALRLIKANQREREIHV